MSKVRVLWVLMLSALMLAVGCGGPSGGASSDDDVGSTTQAAVGDNAVFVSSTFPASMHPGERQVVTVTMQNTGVGAWSTSAPTYALNSQDYAWQWAYTAITTPVAAGANTTFSFVVTAPSTTGTQHFKAKMRTVGGADFGALVDIVVNISNATTPMWDSTFVPGSSSIPTSMAPGANQSVTVVMQNTGTATWPASGLYLVSYDSPANFWVQTSSPLTTSVAPGGSATFTFSIKAPTTPGVYTFKRDMRDTRAGAVGDFHRAPFQLEASITVGGTPALDSSLSSQNFPTTMAPSDVATVSVTLQNTGTETWTAGSTYILNSLNTPSVLWGPTVVNVPADTASGASATFTFNITAPATPGSYAHHWQMRKTSGTNAGYFGVDINVPVTVSGSATPNYGAAVQSQTIPSKVTVGKKYTFTVVMQNTGSQSWSGSNFKLFSTNSPTNVWTATSVSLGAAETVATSATRQFDILVTAPATAGTYNSSWRMRQVSGVDFFGATALTSGIVVTKCGNNVVDAGEQCDDNNLTNGDGCNDTCQYEQIIEDLNTSISSSRNFLGSAANIQLAPVTVGDVTGDGVPEIFMSQSISASSISPARGGAGAVYGFSGGSGFFDGSTSTIPTGSTVQISGAEANDFLGAVNTGRILVGEVTGDSINDLIISAPGADGDSNARSASGEIFVFQGGSALMSAGSIDLKTPPSALTAHIKGKNAGDAIVVLSTADLTGDGQGDLLIGAPGDTTNGSSPFPAGAVYLLAGGSGLTGEIDLATASSVVILGQAGDKLGTIAAVGDFLGGAQNDLVLGAPTGSPSSRDRAGRAYGIVGPVSANRDMTAGVGTATGPDVAWFGASNFDGFGTSAAVGDVTGSSAKEVVIGSIQYQRTAGVQVGAVTVWQPTANSTYDLASTSPTALILGQEQNDDCGSSMQLGDVNNDGRQDIVFACSAADGPSNARSGAGEIDIILGRASLPATYDLLSVPPSWLIYGKASNDFLARHVTGLSVFDIDGDSKADICGGSYLGGDTSFTNAGAVNCIKSPF